MTIDEAIKHAEEVAERQKELYEHRQLAEWLKELKQLREQTKWTHIYDEMPKDGHNVLFCDDYGDIMIGYHVEGRSDTHFTEAGTYDDMKNVRAWMPLPKPYKEEDEERRMKMTFDEEGLLEEPCLSCDKAYVENIWHEWCCDEKECPYKTESEDE